MDYNTLSSLIGDLYVQLKMKDKDIFEQNKLVDTLKVEIELLRAQLINNRTTNDKQ